MDNITPKERILKKIRAGLLYKNPPRLTGIDLESSVYGEMTSPLPEEFAKSFTATGGKLVFCHNKYDLIDNLADLAENYKWKNIFCWDKDLRKELDDVGFAYLSGKENLENAEASLTTCECLVARTGSVVTSSLKNSRSLIAVPRVHIVIAYINQVVPDIKDAVKFLSNRYGKKQPSAITFITGPSRTADIEMQLVQGVHGPEELYVFLVNIKNNKP
ncbi:MAG TPA: lactate utilization protein [Bacteroidia bacterium]|nr:lactate utilization protein [Bacteroidia bacterium]